MSRMASLVSTANDPNLRPAPKGWEPGITYSEGMPDVVTTPLVPEANDPEAYRDMMDEFGWPLPENSRLELVEARYDPMAWSRQAQGEDATTVSCWRYKFKVVSGPISIGVDETLKKRILSARVPKFDNKKVNDAGFVIALSDFQVGKGLVSDTPILTTKGWVNHGDLKVGMEVFGADGRPKKILAVLPTTKRSVYDVTIGDGTVIRCDDQHLWSGSRKYHDNGANGKWVWRHSVISLKELEGISKQKTNFCRPFVLDESDAVEFPERSDLLIDPYVFGLWLGDGFNDSGRIGMLPEDIASIPELRDIVPQKSSPERLSIVTVPGLHTSLAQEGVLKNKSVPEKYLMASQGQRRALLQGLMDTDGHVTDKGACEFTNTNKNIADAVHFLVNSLGMRARVTESVGTLNGETKKPYWRIVFRAKGEVFRLPRKTLRVRASTERTTIYRSVRSVEYAGEQEAQCITVEGGLYLAGKQLTVTHNCGQEGGTDELIDRTMRQMSSVMAECRRIKPSEILLCDLGDAIENFHNTSSQRQTNDLDLTEQIRVWRRILSRFVLEASKLAPSVTVAGVPSNHGRVRLGPKEPASGPWDDYGIDVLASVQDMMEMSDEFSHVKFAYPSRFSETLTVPIVGTNVGLTHGHQVSNPDKIQDYVSKQIAGRQPLESADIILSGHFHHLSVRQGIGGRWFIQAPTNDNGSDWFTNVSGQRSDAGILTFAVHDGQWSELKVHWGEVSE